jgi:hypothetical protein
MVEKQHIKLGVVVFDELSVEAYFNSGGQRPPRSPYLADGRTVQGDDQVVLRGSPGCLDRRRGHSRGRRLAPGHGCFQVISTEERSNRLRPGPTGLTTMWSM